MNCEPYSVFGILIFVFSISSFSCDNGIIDDALWKKYKSVHHKEYEPDADAFRREIFANNVAMIMRHNAEADMKLHTYKLRVNEHVDKTPDELGSMKGFAYSEELGPETFSIPHNFVLPEKVDWRKSGYVTSVKEQNQCSSCYAFAAAAAIEGQFKAATGVLVSLSEQFLIDCSTSEGNHGCDKGSMRKAYEYVKKRGGINLEEDYPYTGVKGECKADTEKFSVPVKSYVEIPKEDEIALAYAVAKVGPVATGFNSENPHFFFYDSGILEVKDCDPHRLDHAMIIVGYGNTDGQDYWILKNSWGPAWGLQGYVHVARNHNNECGVATQASYPVVPKHRSG